MGESSPREATDSPTTFVERFQHFKEDFGVKHPISTSLSHPSLCVLSHEEEPQQTLELNIFDFDGTLFRSPEPNFTKWSAEAVGKLKGHPTTGGLGWFQEARFSLPSLNSFFLTCAAQRLSLCPHPTCHWSLGMSGGTTSSSIEFVTPWHLAPASLVVCSALLLSIGQICAFTDGNLSLPPTIQCC